ncbi:MAG: murein biosynthesis integral membrane protein MurJ, partial [Gemmatimonadetes bacterium]|nr:murein biosynthesis integral membrane protein MurJ [Gemmatimonadota bacterium]
MAGLVRQRVLAHYLGLGDFADALFAAFRIPNFIQNLFGEGALSASFIPSYARLLGEEREEDARRLAGAILALLTLIVAVIVGLGLLGTPWIVRTLEPTWSVEQQERTIRLVRILFPGVGLLVISAWCLGVLNSHRRFLVSYASPVIWNVTI